VQTNSKLVSYHPKNYNTIYTRRITGLPYPRSRQAPIAPPRPPWLAVSLAVGVEGTTTGSLINFCVVRGAGISSSLLLQIIALFPTGSE